MVARDEGRAVRGEGGGGGLAGGRGAGGPGHGGPELDFAGGGGARGAGRGGGGLAGERGADVPGHGVPELDFADGVGARVAGRGGEGLAVGGEGDGADPVVVAPERGPLGERRRVPELDDAVLAAGRQGPPVGVE